MTLLLGIDLGTSTTRALTYDLTCGRITGLASCPTPVSRPLPGTAEHSPEALWGAVVFCLKRLLSEIETRRVAGLAISTFGETALPVDSDGQALFPAIAWYDRRAEKQAGYWEQRFSARELHSITGQPPSIALGANKWLWLREHHPEITRRTAHWLSVADYLLWRFTGVRATSPGIATRTGLFDQRSITWSEELLAFAGLARDQLPPVLASGALVGGLTREAAASTGLPEGLPCVMGGHDQLCAAFAAGGTRPGVVIDSTGTAEALLAVVPAFLSNAALSSAGYACSAHLVPGCFMVRGSLKMGGGAITWLVQQLGAHSASPGALPLPTRELVAEAERGVGRHVGPLWLPHFLGSGTPQGDRQSRAALVGVQAEHNRGDLLRGLLESLAFWLKENLATMAALTGQETERVILLGGTTHLPLLTRLKAAALGRAVYVSGIPEPAALGAALLAGLGVGLFSTSEEALNSVRYEEQRWEPESELTAWYARLYERGYMPLYAAVREIHLQFAHLTAEMNS